MSEDWGKLKWSTRTLVIAVIVGINIGLVIMQIIMYKCVHIGVIQ